MRGGRLLFFASVLFMIDAALASPVTIWYVGPPGGSGTVGSNWNTGVPPGPSDDVLVGQVAGYTGSTDGPVAVNAAASIRSLWISGNGGVNASNPVTVTNDITLDTTASMTLGAAGSTAASVTLSGTSTIALNAAMSTSGAFTINTGTSVGLNANLTVGSLAVNGTGTIVQGGANAVYVGGSAAIAATNPIAALVLIMTGTGTLSSTQNITILQLNAGAGTVSLSSNIPMVTTLNMLGGTLSLGTYSLTVNSNLSLNNAATVAIGAGALALGTHTVSLGNAGASITHTTGSLSASSLTISAGTYSLSGGSVSVGPLSILAGACSASTGSFNVGSLSLTGGSLSFTSNGTITSSGNVSMTTGSFTPGSSTVTMTGAGSTLTVSGGNTLNNLTVNAGVGNSLTLGSSVTISGAYAQSSGTVNAQAAGSQGLSVGGNASIAGDIGSGTSLSTLSVTGTSTFNAGATAVVTTGTQTYGGAVSLNGGTPTLTGSSVSFSSTLSAAAAGVQGLSITGNASFGGIVGGVAGATALQSLSVSGTTTVNTTAITTGGAPGSQSYSGLLTLGADAVLTGTTPTFTAGVNGATHSLTLSFSGTTTINGPSFTNIVNFTSNNGGITYLAGGSFGTSATQSYSDAVVLNATMSLTATSVSFASTLDAAAAGGQGLSITGNASFGGIVGGVAGATALQSLSVSGTTAVNTTAITTGGAPGSQSYSGAVTLLASVAFSTTNSGITFGSTVNGTVAGAQDITLAAGTGTVSVGGAVGGATAIGALTINSGTLSAGTYQIALQGNWANNGGSFIAGSGTVLFGGGGAPSLDSGGSSFNNLTITGGTTVTVVTNPLTVSGTLTVSGNTDSINLQGRSFTIGTLSFGAAGNTGVFSLNGTQSGSSTIASYTATAGTIRLQGNANTLFPQTLPSTYYDLTIAGTTPSTTYTLSSAIQVNNTLLISSGILDVSAASYGIIVGNTWRNDVGATGFVARNGMVTFSGAAGSSFFVNGSTDFYNFTCTVDSATIIVELNTTQTVLPGGTFHVRPASGAGFTIVLRGVLPRTAGVYWYFNLSLGPPSAMLNIAYVDIYDSNAAANQITTPANVNAGLAYNDLGWLSTDLVVSSRTADLNGDGKIDAIVVTVETAIVNDFSGFVASVSGYTVTGYQIVTPGPGTEFYIHLAEHQNLDTDAKPTWSIVSNTTLVDSATLQHLVAFGPAYPLADHPIDTAAPIVGYTLAVAGRSRVFVAFSEPVVNTGGTVVTPGNFSVAGHAIGGLSLITTQGAGTRELELDLSTPVSPTDVIDQATITFNNIEDMAATPNALALATHRITDLGLGPPGAGIVEPVWASDQSRTDPLRGGIGVIHTFDGSAWLQAQQLTIQGLITTAYAAVGGLQISLAYDTNVPGSYRFGSLWLPSFDVSKYDGLVPTPDTGAQSVAAPLSTPNPYLRQAVVPSGDAKVSSGKSFEFFFQIDGAAPLLCADLPSPDASDWYRLVRPWSFTLRNVVVQRSNVTILDNVINPLKGDRVNLIYTITQPGSVTINVFDLAGHLVNILYRGTLAAGQYSTTWDGRNSTGQAVARGIYLIRVVAPEIDEFRKVLVVK